MIEVLAAVSTLLAALAAGFSAWNSRTSAKASREAVEEARVARQDRLAPRLTLEKNFLDFKFIWPSADDVIEPAFLSRKHAQDTQFERPTFTLQNFGQSPALELSIAFELDDPNGELDVPETYRQLGLNVTEEVDAIPDGPPAMSLTYSRPDGSGMGIPLYRRWTTEIPHCAPNQGRIVEFPMWLLNRLFLRGLQDRDARQAGKPLQPIVLVCQINCHATDGTEYLTQFRWKIIPFHRGSTGRIEVAGHCFELPMYPKPDKPRVA